MEKKQSSIVIKVNGKEKKHEDHDQKTNQAFPWVLPEKEEEKNVVFFPVQEEDKERPSLSKKLKHPPVIIGLAILIGLSFGLLILQFFKNEEPPVPMNTAPVIDHEQKQEPVDPPKEQTGHLADMVDIERKQSRVFLLQHGVYSNEKTAQEQVRQLKAKGYPAALNKREEKWVIYSFLFSSKEKAEAKKQMFDTQGIDCYVKELSTIATPVSIEKGQADKVKAYVDLFPQIITLSIQPKAFEDVYTKGKKLTQPEAKAYEEKIQALISSIKKAESEQVIQQHLLEAWIAYEALPTKRP